MTRHEHGTLGGYYYTIGFSLPSISEFMDLLDQEWVEMFDLEFEDVS
jgi:hypothetical protein